MKTRTTGLIAVLGITALLAAGCGSSKSSSSTSATSAYPSESEKSTSTAASTTPATTPATGGGVTVTVKHASKLGTVLAVGSKKMTVYMFEGDKGGTSNCTGACASAWPPVTTSGSPTAKGAANSADLGTIARADGTTQVTYKGHPLYFFVKDKDAGDSYGQGVHGFGADWYVLAPSGSKVDKS